MLNLGIWDYPNIINRNLNTMKNIVLKSFATLAIVLAVSCGSDDSASPIPDPIAEETFIRAADFSFLPELESENTPFYNQGSAQEVLTTFQLSGGNFVRIRLWKDPSNEHSSLQEAKALAQRVHAKGMKVWLTVHYSDVWADPGNQTTPAAWQSLDYAALKTAVAQYTASVLNEIHPDIIQIGNETNDGMLWPMGKLSTNAAQSKGLFEAASAQIRSQSPDTKIMLHFAGTSGAEWFFNHMSTIDYDYIGLSYYPVWHGTNLTALQNTINSLGQTHDKKVLIAETAYPFTLDWDDWTNNIVGLENQLVPNYPATPQGQKDFLLQIRSIVENSEYGLGFAYWGGEWLAFRGPEATNGSTFENQALYDFDHNALPVFDAFAE